MQDYKFNFVRKRKKKIEFTPLYTKLNTTTTMSKNVFYFIRSLLITIAIFTIFLFSLNLIVRYFFDSIKIKPEKISFEIPFFKSEKFLIIKDNLYIVYSNGKKELVENNIDSKTLPVITGVELNEKRPEYKSAYLQTLKIKNRYLSKISEVNLKDTNNIILITVDGKKVYMGNSITNEKMKNLYIVMQKTGKKYSYLDLRYKNRVIIK
ncbi:MAG: cell division protein FtsQ [Candidatus Goldbacteria bacterium]|nr:cell division protein FtsQ [Candidatus Goldiibacteriota bacterium]